MSEEDECGAAWYRHGQTIGACARVVVAHERRTSMSLHQELVGPVPEETARVARAAFPKGHPCLRLRDKLGTI